jgi:hypothetical protein
MPCVWLDTAWHFFAGHTVGSSAAGSSDSSQTQLRHLEAVLEHARTKGRHVVLANCERMDWQPTTRERGRASMLGSLSCSVPLRSTAKCSCPLLCP